MSCCVGNLIWGSGVSCVSAYIMLIFTSSINRRPFATEPSTRLVLCFHSISSPKLRTLSVIIIIISPIIVVTSIIIIAPIIGVVVCITVIVPTRLITSIRVSLAIFITASTAIMIASTILGGTALTTESTAVFWPYPTSINTNTAVITSIASANITPAVRGISAGLHRALMLAPAPLVLNALCVFEATVVGIASSILLVVLGVSFFISTSPLLFGVILLKILLLLVIVCRLAVACSLAILLTVV